MAEHTAIAFGELLSIFRTRRGLSQRRLAEHMGVHRNTISTWERGEYLPQSKALVLELARRLHLEEHERRQLLEASLTALSPSFVVPLLRNPFFTGREQILQTLHTQLAAERAGRLPHACALSGLGGVGKTQIALEYAYYRSGESPVLMLRAYYYKCGKVGGRAKDERLDSSRNATRCAICSPSTPRTTRPKS